MCAKSNLVSRIKAKLSFEREAHYAKKLSAVLEVFRERGRVRSQCGLMLMGDYILGKNLAFPFCNEVHLV
ncbi:hypothetical protein [Vibrio anguillarum]|uniref:Uncharacterized protein n=1 Tax=Vibrio ordalii FS-238 TaxID=617133 RepID=A0A853RAD9_9VIBR|nr:hypothetical protein PN51_15155 [Vibrio anguillarum]MBT2929318.1 hypothetical protein [Vibrio anguillarum]MBY7668205.1 hypothetical protein [Vibrio anguillarum]OEE41818.1 hypothetical protein A1QS_12910 [Vibrio ordalii FS-238]OEE50059.1 hypothetical protein A1QU_12055 [Vibrio anguillarum]